ncbi:succinylglutamate-semialdehyde dehydrogenase [Halioxenophilus aromaticivorans]
MIEQLSQLTGEHFINGKWQAGDDQILHPENPGLQQTGWSGVSASKNLVGQAVAAARAAFDAWAMLPFEQREVVVRNYAQALKSHSDLFAQVIHLETGKPLWESKTEAAAMVGKVELSIIAYHARTGHRRDETGPVVTQLSHKPQGVLAVLGPYNFPGHLPNGHIVPALLAGNCIVFKPSEATPATAELMLRCWQQAGLPSGVINMVQGAGDTGKALAGHSDINGLLFTGSSRTGAALHQLFGGQPEKILALEMGGNNPLVVEQVADIDACVYNILQSAFVSAGQRCTCARRLIMLRCEHNQKTLQALVEASKQMAVGFGEEDFYGPVIHEAAAEQLLTAQMNLIDAGGHPLLTMAKLHEHKPLLGPGIMDVTNVAELPDEEYFGPLLQVLWVDTLEQAVIAANKTRFGLSAGLLADDVAAWDYFSPRINAGIVNWNRPLTGASGAAPFGGMGASGNHRPSAYYAADYCAHPVASLLADKVELPPALSPGIKL